MKEAPRYCVLLLGLLTMLFIGLRLSGLTDWPWWTVLSPLWIGLIAGLLILVALLVFNRWRH